jgi:hypothetical protein
VADDQQEQPRRPARRRPARVRSARAAAKLAARELAALTGKVPEAVVGLQRAESGWLIGLEIVEAKRIPETADILAHYEIEIDEEGTLQGYRRVRRYLRGNTQEG